MNISNVNLNEIDINKVDYTEFLLLKANDILSFMQYFEDESLYEELAAIVEELESEGIEF